MPTIHLNQYGITVEDVQRNLQPPDLYREAILHESDTAIAKSGALIAYSGQKTGRSPKDKRVVDTTESHDDIWWGPINIPISEKTYQINRERAIDYLNTRERLYVVDGFAGWGPHVTVSRFASSARGRTMRCSCIRC